MTRLEFGFWVIERKTEDVKSQFHHIISRVPIINPTYVIDVNLNHLAKYCLSGFYPVKLFFLLCPHSALWKGKLKKEWSLV